MKTFENKMITIKGASRTTIAILLLIAGMILQEIHPVNSYEVIQCKSCNKTLNYANLVELKELSDNEDIKVSGRILKPILVERVSGSAQIELVKNFIISEFTKLKWNVEVDEFEDDTPFGRKTFSNIIVTENPSLPNRIILSAHYDSKYFPPPKIFLAATDSAVSCALLIDLAIKLDPLIKQNSLRSNTSLQLIFFDGEEAFVDWTDTDSLYGSRHLATNWAHKLSYGRYRPGHFIRSNELSTIEVLILLDLLGSIDSQVYSLQASTHYYFVLLAEIERQIFEYGLQPKGLTRPVFYNQQYDAFVDDDHRPFHDLGVPVVNLIPLPFPWFWHTIYDNHDVVHHPTVSHLALLFRAFVARLLCLYN